ncbi:uncharacterized protein LOC144165726 [Haemaphysalis longicornis]
MDNLFRGTRHVAVYLNDILVTGTDGEDHLQNLYKFVSPCKVHYFLVVVYAFSMSVEVLSVTTSSEGATMVALRPVFTGQGLLDVIVSYKDPAFASEEHLAWLTKSGIRRIMVPPYHPVLQTVKDKLKNSKAGDFQTQVARVLF